MADDVTLNSMTGGDVIGADEISGVKYQRVKIIVGANNTNDGDVASGNPMPIAGTVTANLSATDNAVLDAAVTALELIDNSVDGNYLNINCNIAGTDFLGGAGAVAAGVQRVTLASDDPAVTALQLIDNAISGAGFNITQLGGAAVPIGAGTEATAVRVTLPTDGTGKVTVVSGTASNLKAEVTIAATQTLATVTTVGTVTTLTGGGIAHDSGDSGNPVKVGTKCESTPSAQVVADADRSDVLSDMDGAVFVRSGVLIGDILNHSFSDATGNNTADTVFTTGAGIRNVITDVVAYNSSATGGYCILTDGNGGTVLLYVPLPAGGGCVINLQTPIKTTANTALYWDISAALSTVYMTITGYRTRVT